MITLKDIAWLAGLLEGEGSFGRTSKGNCINIQLNMTDKDIVVRAAKLLNAQGIYDARRKRPAHHKPQWSICVAGPDAAGWMMTIYPLMGTRRKARIRELLTQYSTARRQSKSTLVCPHTDDHRRHRTVCDRCYQHDWYVKRKSKDVMPHECATNCPVI